MAMPDGIDPRIMEIMAKLNQGSRAEEEAPKEELVVAKVEEWKPPKTYEEFIKAEGMEEWPQRITSENLLDLEEDRYMLGTKDDIIKELRDAAPFACNKLDDLEDRLLALEAKLNVYSDKVLTNEIRSSRIRDNLFHSPTRAFLTEGEGLISPRKMRQDLQERKKTVENCSFPGFRRGELTELPGQLEAPQLLHRITKAQDFNPGFRKFWKKIFLSEASVAMMQDTFWWIFIANFERQHQSDQDKLFDRIADSFVALFTSINPEVKDKFFAVYPDCLAQAIFAAFHQVFPDSPSQISDRFKQNVANLVHEWITGSHPPVGTWEKWDINRLEHRTRGGESNTKNKKAAKSSLDFDGFEKLVNKLGSDSASRLGTAPNANMTPMMSREVTKLTALSSMLMPALPAAQSRLALPAPPQAKTIESHPVGPGPTYEQVMFSLKGRSPLVAHYLYMRELRSNKHRGKQVKRTEITKRPPGGQTYRELINSTKARSQNLSKEYQKICDQAAQDIQKIERQKRIMTKQIDDLRKEIVFAKSVVEIKMISEKILEKKGVDSKISQLAISDGVVEEDDYDDDEDSDYQPL